MRYRCNCNGFPVSGEGVHATGHTIRHKYGNLEGQHDPHALFREGAELVKTAADFFQEFGAVVLRSGKNPTRSDFSTTQPQLEYIDYVPTPIDHIVKRSQLTATTVCSMLIRLAMQGQVQCGPGGYLFALEPAPEKTSPTHER